MGGRKRNQSKGNKERRREKSLASVEVGSKEKACAKLRDLQSLQESGHEEALPGVIAQIPSNVR